MNYDGYVLDYETQGIMGNFLCATLHNSELDELCTYTELEPFIEQMKAIEGSSIWAHNVSYEHQYTAKLGIDVSKYNWYCTQVLAHCVDKENKAEKSSLDYLSAMYCPSQRKLDFTPSVPWEQFNQSCSDWDAMVEYNRMDVLATVALKQALLDSVGSHLKLSPSNKPKIVARMQAKLKDYFFNIRMPFLMRVLIPAREHGLTMDTAQVKYIIDLCNKLTGDLPYYDVPKLVKGQPVFVRDYKDKETKVWVQKQKTLRLQLTSSTNKSVAWFFTQNGLGKYVSKTTGNINVAAIDVNTTEPHLRDIVYGSFLGTIKSYMTSYFKYAVPIDTSKFSVHSYLNLNGTQTGRLSSSTPNIQNISGSKSIANPDIQAVYKEIRKIVVARDGYTFISADFDRIELTILSKVLEPWDTGLRDTLNTNQDVHQYNADKWSLDRLTAKRLIFSLIYGATEHKVADIMNCTVTKAKRVLEQIFEGMPALGKAMAKYVQQCYDLGGVYDLFGDFKNYPDIYASEKWRRSRVERQVFNAVMQGTNASMIAWYTPQMVDIIQSYGGTLTAIVHDEMLAEVPTEQVDMCLIALNKLTQERYDIPGLEGCRVNADWFKGNNWSETK
jgi:DNA polymerase I-like protein with 3'-5' exonuclease and polymerase domains